MSVIAVDRIGAVRGLYRPNFSNPDFVAENYGRFGEFSPMADISFEKHIKKLASLKDFFMSKNGNRIKSILMCEKNWYPV